MAAPGKCLLVTGAPGVGKTTLITRVFEALKASNPNLKVKSGEEEGRGLDSSSDSLRWPTVGRYKVDVASFESLALPVLQVKEDIDLYIIDEVGKMELYSSSFLPAVLKVLESNLPVLASVPIPKFGRDVPGVARVKNHPGAKLYALTDGNRDAIGEQIYSELSNLLPKRSV